MLSPRSREVLECVHLKEYEICRSGGITGISVATVKTLLVRSLRR